MKTSALVLISCVFPLMLWAQDGTFTITYSGLPQGAASPHNSDRQSEDGIKNPERGYTIQGGVFDVFTQDLNTPYFENITGGTILEPLPDYIQNFESDGISLVEIEGYFNYKDDHTSSLSALDTNDLNAVTSVINTTLADLGLKSHLILNSSLDFFQNSSDVNKSDLDHLDNRYIKNVATFEQASHLLNDISPYVAVAHLGWLRMPWNFNSYRLSGHWKRSNADIGTNYPIGDVNTSVEYSNFHNHYRKSVQRHAWGIPHSEATIWNYHSGINHLKTSILDRTLDLFPNQKVLLGSTMSVGIYIGNKMSPGLPVYTPTYTENFVDIALSGPYAGENLPFLFHRLKDDDQFTRIGYYENAFGGSTYSNYWTIGNAQSQKIQWSSDESGSLGVDWANNPFFTDVNNLRRNRHNMWMHGEMPTYETEDPTINTNQNYLALNNSSFTDNFLHFAHWYDDLNPTPNHQYNYEELEGMCSGRLQDGFDSALKLRYFNFTSFGITHNNLLDGRSPYEMQDGFVIAPDGLDTDSLEGNGIPDAANTAIAGWKSKLLTKSELQDFRMPISANYFENETGNPIDRTAYDYIRDHLGYRLELQSTSMTVNGSNVSFNTNIINRGFAAPQNKRTLYIVLLDANNDVIQYQATNTDWRDWQPDVFARADLNTNTLQYPLTSAIYENYDDIIIGGIPLGEYQSDWHESPIIPSYSPYTYTVSGNFDLTGLTGGQYKIALWLPDFSPTLWQNADYAVKFANHAHYDACLGMTILASVAYNTTSFDTDGDGVLNAADANPYNPIEFVQTANSPCANPNFGNIGLTEFISPSVPTQKLSFFPNPSQDYITIANNIEWSVLTIYDVRGQRLHTIEKTTDNQISVKNLIPGQYLLRAHSENYVYTAKFTKI
ncbi:MAG: DUF4832 domain-containing protein [Flavobacteriales bacterium]